MDEFSYLSVLISVILGLAVAQVLKGIREILLSQARIMRRMDLVDPTSRLNQWQVRFPKA
jgi:hypothetical protein